MLLLSVAAVAKGLRHQLSLHGGGTPKTLPDMVLPWKVEFLSPGDCQLSSE